MKSGDFSGQNREKNCWIWRIFRAKPPQMTKKAWSLETFHIRIVRKTVEFGEFLEQNLIKWWKKREVWRLFRSESWEKVWNWRIYRAKSHQMAKKAWSLETFQVRIARKTVEIGQFLEQNPFKWWKKLEIWRLFRAESREKLWNLDNF